MNLNQKEKASALIKNVFLAIVVGPVVGALDAFFGRILIAVSAFREALNPLSLHDALPI